MVAFAAAADLVSGRALTDQELVDANVLLARASRYIRREFPGIDARITAGELTAEDVSDVVCAMVERALLNPRRGVESSSETIGPYAVTERYANAEGGLYLTAAERAVFSRKTSPSRRAFSISTLPDVC